MINNNVSFSQKIESIQYNAAIAITGAITETSQLKLNKELGLESLKFRRWFNKLTAFYKPINTVLPQYLINLIPHGSHYYNTELAGTTTTYHFKTNFSSIFFSFNNL